MIYTLEIEGNAIAALRARDIAQAQDLVQDEDFQDDLRILETDNGPLWDGEATVTVREASEAERALFEDSWNQGVTEGEIDPNEEDIHVVFLVEVYEDDDEDDEEE